MKPRQTTTTAFVLLVAAMAAWFIVRSHYPSPEASSAGDAHDDISRSSPSPTVVPTIPGTTAGTNLPTVLPQDSRLPDNSPAPRSPVPSVLQATTSNPIANVAATPSETASTNAIRVRRMITDYHTLNGENPVGTNAEIMEAIMGKNSRQAILGPPEGLSLNSKGELIDDWGTPYFFHQLSKDNMEIHSAGPDRIMGTNDDIVVR